MSRLLQIAPGGSRVSYLCLYETLLRVNTILLATDYGSNPWTGGMGATGADAYSATR